MAVGSIPTGRTMDITLDIHPALAAFLFALVAYLVLVTIERKQP